MDSDAADPKNAADGKNGHEATPADQTTQGDKTPLYDPEQLELNNKNDQTMAGTAGAAGSPDPKKPDPG
eukprot:612629-Rhodomonas_salina.2